jgi:hypothetical protein
MDERDLAAGTPALDELRTDIVVDVEPFRIGRRKVAEDELRASARFWVACQIADDARNGAIDLRLDSGCASGSISRMSSAAFRPSPVIFSMLSTDGSTRSFFSRSARSVRVRMNALSSGSRARLRWPVCRFQVPGEGGSAYPPFARRPRCGTQKAIPAG